MTVRESQSQHPTCQQTADRAVIKKQANRLSKEMNPTDSQENCMQQRKT